MSKVDDPMSGWFCRGCGAGDKTKRTGRARGKQREWHCECGTTGWTIDRSVRWLRLLSEVGCPCDLCQEARG